MCVIGVGKVYGEPLPPLPIVASLYVVTEVDNTGGGTAQACNFTVHVKNADGDVPESPASGEMVPGTLYHFGPEVYTVSEDPYPSYAYTFLGDCDSDGNVDATVNPTKTCTVLNTYVLPPSSPPSPPAPQEPVAETTTPVTNSNCTSGGSGFVSQAELQKAFPSTVTTLSPVFSQANFLNNLGVGSIGQDVSDLQTWLENNELLVMPDGVAKGYFGQLTKSAVARYQALRGIVPQVGYFGPVTRAAISSRVAN